MKKQEIIQQRSLAQDYWQARLNWQDRLDIMQKCNSSALKGIKALRACFDYIIINNQSELKQFASEKQEELEAIMNS